MMFTNLDMTHSSFLLELVAFITMGTKSIPISCTYKHLTLTTKHAIILLFESVVQWDW